MARTLTMRYRTAADLAGTRERRLVAIGGLAAGAYLAGRAILRASRRMDLAGKVALVTGGSRGLGLAISRELVAAGCHVAICARDEAELQRAKDDLMAAVARTLDQLHA